MPIQYVKALQAVTGKASFHITFWIDYDSSEPHTFQNFLDQYKAYYASLNKAQKKPMSLIFWQEIEKIGTPIIEDNSEEKDACDVYFLYTKNKMRDGNDLYLQGDFHG